MSDHYLVGIVILCHSEGVLLRDTFYSIIRAIDYSRINGTLQADNFCILLALDSPDADTRDIALNISENDWSSIKVSSAIIDFRDPGLSRNWAIESLKSHYIMVIDGDDLISPDFISNFLVRSDRGIILHPEYLVTFGQKALIWRQPSFSRLLGKEQLMLTANPYDTCSIGERSLYLKVLFSEARQSLGHGYEDWHFTLESNFHGVPHDVIPGTIKYTRIKPVSRLRADRLHSSIMPYSLYIELLTTP